MGFSSTDAGTRRSRVGRFAIHHAKAIVFISVVLCLAGLYAALVMPSSVFPQTDFPRVVILVDNGVMPADEMMARITRPIEEAMKDIPGTTTIRSATGRGAAEINVFFDWHVDMVQSELYVIGRLSGIRAGLPATASTSVWRLTFSAFPILGVSLTSDRRDLTELWEKARYDLKPRFLRIPGVARVDLVGGRAPEYHLVIDLLRMEALGVDPRDVVTMLEMNNAVVAAGMHEEHHKMYLGVVDGRVHGKKDIEDLSVNGDQGRLVRIGEFAHVQRAPETVFNRVTADGHDAVLLNIRSQPDGSTLQIAQQLRKELKKLKGELPEDMKLAFFYDQSERVHESVRSVWDAILFGLLLSITIIYLFLRSWRITLIATAVIPVTVLITLVAMHLGRMSFNLMTLGGIAAAIGLVIDDAIVVVEAIQSQRAAGLGRHEAVEAAMAEILRPLIGSTLTPVVVFVPLAYLTGVAGVFFRALALTMVVSLLTSLALALTLTPSLASVLLRSQSNAGAAQRHVVLSRVQNLYEQVLRRALRHPWRTVLAAAVLVALTAFAYRLLPSEFLPPMDEGGFVIDYHTPWGTSLAETDRQLKKAEAILMSIPEVESYSRRTGARLALAIAEPNTGDFLVKLRRNRKRSTDDVIAELRRRFTQAIPGIEWEFPGILSDLIGDLTWAPQPVEIKIFSNDVDVLRDNAPQIKSVIDKVPGIVDSFDGLVMTGPSVSVRVRPDQARRFGLSAEDIAEVIHTAMLGRMASSVLEGDRLVAIRVVMDAAATDRIVSLGTLPLRTPDGQRIQLLQVADIREEPGQLELRREDLRQDVAVTARLEGRDLGSAIREIQQHLREGPILGDASIEFGGLYERQRESFRNLLLVLATAILLVYVVLLIEFRRYRAPLAIIGGAVLSLSGAVAGLLATGTTVNIVSMLGAIIGVGIVAKNGILMLDFVGHYREAGLDFAEALIQAGRRRLRPVLMTSLAAALGMLPLAYGIGAGADMLKPLAVAVIGALTISVLLALVATPVGYFVLHRSFERRERKPTASG